MFLVATVLPGFDMLLGMDIVRKMGGTYSRVNGVVEFGSQAETNVAATASCACSGKALSSRKLGQTIRALSGVFIKRGPPTELVTNNSRTFRSGEVNKLCECGVLGSYFAGLTELVEMVLLSESIGRSKECKRKVRGRAFRTYYFGITLRHGMGLQQKLLRTACSVRISLVESWGTSL